MLFERKHMSPGKQQNSSAFLIICVPMGGLPRGTNVVKQPRSLTWLVWRRRMRPARPPQEPQVPPRSPQGHPRNSQCLPKSPQELSETSSRDRHYINKLPINRRAAVMLLYYITLYYIILYYILLYDET